MAGMRRNEIDKALWSWVDWTAGCIRITPTKDFRTKSDDAVRSVWLPAEVLGILRGYRARATSSFILESKVKARPDKLYDHYRAATQFEKLISWLRSKRVNGAKPVHTLRKEFGSLIAQKFGIFAAKEMLGHADIATTSAHYLETKTKPIIELGSLLNAG
jgi:integrase